MPNTIARRRTHQPRSREQWDVLSSRWTAWPSGAAMAVAGGAVQGSTLAADGHNLCANGEFTVNTAGWSAMTGATVSRVNSAVDPGAASGGLDDWCLKIVAGALQFASARYPITTYVLGASYRLAERVYANTAGRPAACNLYCGNSNFIYTGTIGSWVAAAVTGIATNTAGHIDQFVNGAAGAGPAIYGDAVTCYATVAGVYWPLCPSLRLHHVIPIPAAGTTPRGFVYRWTDALNYWELRILPNTAGTDAYLLERNAGAYTTRASADVDWTAGGNDEVMVSLAGNTITVWVRKSGAAGWTQTLQYTSATFNNTAYRHGVLAYDTGIPVCSMFEEVP